jgi:hypothetical protein
MNVEIGTEAAQLPEKEYINGIFVAVRVVDEIYIAEYDIRETNEGLPLLIVETEAIGDKWRTNKRGPSLVVSLVSLCRYKRFLFIALATLVACRPSAKYFFLTVDYFSYFVRIAKQTRQAIALDRLSVCLWVQSSHPPRI